jgi:hypothetical protein
VTDRWAEVDEHILNHRIIRALQALREKFEYTIPEALDAFNQRYEQLREARPGEFTVSREEYGKGVYT